MERNIFMKRAQSRGDSGFARVFTMLALLFITATGAWADDTYTIKFEANGNSKTVENVTLPHTFSADGSNENGELDEIIKQLYGLSMGCCDYNNSPEVSGSSNVTAQIDGTCQLITISAPFEGNATVTGIFYGEWYEEFNYSLTISCPGYTAPIAANTYAVTVKDGTEDAANWTITPSTATAGETVTATYTGKKKVKAITITKKENALVGTIYSWESPEGTPIETGGTIEYVNGDGDRLNYLNSGYYTICLNGKKANLNDETPSANAGKMVITLDNALAAGDVISFTGYITKNESKKSSAYILYENGQVTESPAFSDESNIDPTFTGSITTKEVTVSDEAAGSKTITMTRGQTGTNLFITKLVITRGETNN